MWTITTSTLMKSMELKFRLGEEFEETTPDGRKVTSIVTKVWPPKQLFYVSFL